MYALISRLFIWWRGYTIGTSIFTYFNGVHVGTDAVGNRYFQSSNGVRRWVLYSGESDATSMPPPWHAWIHKITNDIPGEVALSLEKKSILYRRNMTGTSGAYHPNQANDAGEFQEYSAWKPKDKR